MADASLTVKMALDRLALKQGLEGAGKDVDSFKKKFESSLNETRGAVKDVAGSIDGIGRALDGSIQGAVSGFKDFTQLLTASPWAAWAAAAVAAITAVIKSSEKMYTELDEAGGKAGKARAKSRRDVVKALGLDEQAKINGKSFEELKEGSADATSEAEKLTKQITDLNEQITRMESHVSAIEVIWPGAVTSDQVIELKKNLAELEKQRGEAAAKANTLTDAATAKELAAERAKVEAHNKRVREQLKADEEMAQAIAKNDQEEKDRNQKLFELQQNYDEEVAKLYEEQRASEGKQYSSIFDRSDMYQRIGGQVGANISGALKREDKVAQAAADQLKVSEQINSKLQELNNKLEEATRKLVGDD